MEDSHIADLKNLGQGKYVFGVFDGHGGMEVSEFVKRHFVKELVKNQNFKDGNYEKALYENFMRMDEIMLKQDGKKELLNIKKENGEDGTNESFAGCTANVCLIVDGKLYVANAGDSRTLLSHGG